MRFPGILIGGIGGWVAAGAVLTLAGCGGSSSGSGDPRPEETVAAPTTMAGPGCVSGTDFAGQMSDPRVTQVRILGDCQGLSVSTVLTDDESDLALQVCDAAVHQAAGAFGSIKVIGESGTELATGSGTGSCRT
jgi:hypothetical protein